MRSSIVLLILIVILAGCRKEMQSPDPFSRVKQQLTDSLPAGIFQNLDFKSSLFTRANGEEYLRIGFKDSSIDGNFLLLRLNQAGAIQAGRCINMHIIATSGMANGQISIHYLNGSVILDHALIAGGFIHWGPGEWGLREMLLPGADGKVLPEVIVVASYKKPNPTTSYYYLLAGLMGGGSAGNSGYYSSSSSGSGGAAGSTSGGGTGKALPAGKSDSKMDNSKAGADPDVILVDFETAQQNPAINLDQYIKCFAVVPDNGAACTIEILADIPVDGHPESLFNWSNGSPGHCFLRLQKTNGLNSVIQLIGFYPQAGWKTVTTPAPVEGKFADNGGHEFNASIKMNLSSAQLQAVLTELGRHKGSRYDIDEYNCTDFALEIFNYQRTSKLVIPKYDLPGGQAPFGSSTPQGLYTQLKAMKAAGAAEASNINIPAVKGYVANSKGPCN